jgi:hypothetical protein
MAIRLGPFVVLRSRLTTSEYADLADEAIGTLSPVAGLLSTRGIRRGQLPAGQARMVERDVVDEQRANVRSIERRLEEVYPPGEFVGLHHSLRRAVDLYRRTLEAYSGASAAIEAADPESYQEDNRRGRELDGMACDAFAELLIAARDSGITAPDTLQQLVERRAALERVMGGAIAYWDQPTSGPE